jgi:hypothetical protein
MFANVKRKGCPGAGGRDGEDGGDDDDGGENLNSSPHPLPSRPEEYSNNDAACDNERANGKEDVFLRPI